nr:FkbM family methyltransferase [Thiocapsa marina]
MATDRGNAPRDGLRALLGVARSLRIYYLHRRRSRMDAFYRAFLDPDDLAFDIGCHVGDRIGAFRRIGARVLAVEPQPMMVRTLRWLYGRDPAVRIEASAVGRASGRAQLQVNRANPTVSTLSTGFISAARGASGWESQHWDGAIEVACTRLDDLIERHGMPRFVKIDVEGYEAEVLGGLTRPADALSFEFTTIQRDVGHRALAECSRLGYARFNAALGESYVFAHDAWVDAAAIGRWLDALPHTANSGDIYAR